MRSANRLGKEYYDKALNFVNKAIEHTPTVIELYIHKAKIYQRLGDHEKAA
jgi:peptide alpha-N-acetyltransferase